jgi:ferrochelatase
MRYKILVVNMGGPSSLDEVGPYLYEIFSDPELIKIPLRGVFRKVFARWLSKKREPESREIYAAIGGSTPLNDYTREQAKMLELELQKLQPRHEWKVYMGMRYWHPFMEESWEEMLADRVDDTDALIVLPLYPFYSASTTGSIIKEAERLMAKQAIAKNLLQIDRFGANEMFLDAMAADIQDALDKAKQEGKSIDDVLCSAHSLPLREIKKGDPYQKEVEAAFAGLKKRLPKVRLHLSFQSKVGPVAWLGPATEDKLKELAEMRVKSLLAYPLGFVADNSETLYEIHQEYGELARSLGITNFITVKALNGSPLFVQALALEVQNAIGA